MTIHPFRGFSAILVLPAVLMSLSPAPSAYAQAPASREVGCFPDNRKADPLGTRGRDLDGAAFKDPSMTVKQCLSLCSGQGFKYAGLQSGAWCFCGNSYGRHKAASASCTTKCAGDQKLICGGEWTNSIWELLESRATTPPVTPLAPSQGQTATVPPPRGAAQSKRRFDKPKLGAIRLDSRPATGLGFDMVGVAQSFCQRMGFSRMLEYRVASAGQTIAIEDSTVFTNNKGSNTTYRFIVCGP